MNSAASDPIVPPVWSSTRARVTVGILALLGAALLAVQLRAYGAWLLASPLAPVRPAVPVPSDVRSNVRVAELTSIIGAIVWLGYVGRDWWQRRTLTWPLLWTVAWACVF